MLRINNINADSVFQRIRKIYRIIAPLEKIGKGRFSNTNLVTYDEVNPVRNKTPEASADAQAHRISNGVKEERKRIWSSCQVKKFSLLAGNHDFRIPYGDRMRYRVLHKISDFRKRTGINMCVGCGRCDDVCPEYISMFKCIERIHPHTNFQNHLI